MAAGRPFIFHVEQQSLNFQIDPREMGLEYHKRVRKLLGFDFQLQKNRVAMHYLDASHRTSLVGPWFQAQDPFLAQLINEIKEGKTIKGFSMEHNQLLYKGRKVIPSSSHTRSAPPLWWFSIWRLLQWPEDVPSSRRRMVLAGMRKVAASYVQQCPICKQHEASTQSPADLLQQSLA